MPSQSGPPALHPIPTLRSPRNRLIAAAIGCGCIVRHSERAAPGKWAYRKTGHRRPQPVTFEPSRSILESDNDPLAECRQCGLNSFGLCVVLRVKHAADNGFADAKPFGQLRISNSALAHGQIEGKLGRQAERNADWILAALQLARDRNSVAARDPSGKGFGQAVNSLHERVVEVGPPRERFGKIGKPDVKAFAVPFG